MSPSVNRDLSLLNFNERILQEAADPTTPLFERITFLGIFSNNLDEFYRTRYAALERAFGEKASGKNGAAKIDHARTVFASIETELTRLFGEFDKTLAEVKAELEKKQVRFLDESQLDAGQKLIVDRYFQEHVRKNITPIMLENLDSTTSLKDQSTYLLARLGSASDPEKIGYALIELPIGELSRFFVLPPDEEEKIGVMYLDDVIRFALPDLFSVFGYDRFEAYSLKFNRDADVDFSRADSRDYLDDIESNLKKRRLGETVRLVYDHRMPPELLAKIARIFGIRQRDTLKPSGRYQNQKDLVKIPKSHVPPEMLYEPFPQLPVPRLLDPNRSILDIVREKDVLLHYPYHSFDNIVNMLLQASIDPNVRAIKMTIYRVAKNSRVVNALINAARNRKKVTVYIEFKASFDEEANIDWAEKMKSEGIEIVYYAPKGLKVHSKLLLIQRKENGKKISYAAVGTGNPNEDTSRFYCDEHLLTANPAITGDAKKVFKLLESKKCKNPGFKALVVSPFAIRKTFLEKIDREIGFAVEGKPAWMIVKLNNLVDDKLVKKLYEASQAGVKIQLIVRGMCTLVPGLPGVSDNITTVRIVDRFLEHARILVFGNGNSPEYYLGSADWMQRNLDRRIEVMVPVEDPDLQKDLQKILQLQLSDNVKAKPINPGDITEKTKSGKPVRSQWAIYEYLKKQGQQS